MITRCQGTRFRADGDLEHVWFARSGGGTSQAVSGSFPRLRPEWTQIDFLRRGAASGLCGGARRSADTYPETRRSDSGVLLSARREKAEWPLPGLPSESCGRPDCASPRPTPPGQPDRGALRARCGSSPWRIRTTAAIPRRVGPAYRGWRNAHARHPDVLAAQRKESARARIRSEKDTCWGGRSLSA